MKGNKNLKLFIVCMDSSYVRDAQMLDTRDLSDEEFAESTDSEELWHDMEPTPYIDCVLAENKHSACETVGKNKRYDPRCLFAIYVK